MTDSKIRLPHSVIVRSPGLLPMLYTVTELAKTMGVVDRTLRDWLIHGAPHLRDSSGHIWIVGTAFSRWVAQMRKPVRKRRLGDNQGYCLHCRTIVDLIEPETERVRGKLTHTRGTCPLCGRTIHRGGRIASNPKPLASDKEPIDD